MYWTLELASYLEEAPWPATKDELIDYAIRSGAPGEVIDNLDELEDAAATVGGEVTRERWRLDGDAACVFRIRPAGAC